MKTHMFKAGDTVTLRERPIQSRGADDAFKIVAALPPSNGSFQYRVRSERETHDRMMPEDDLKRVSN
ncbi:hypothetical protein [Pararhizobium sp.]|uniref:hypothetical protein n=1 Tax=Pararhizobium sp. TaxID=1977563 RepID=UPI002721FA1E|nr:hypothetical protein [Pararhizobium sp.]MDO9414881.1 hypothetical protein [Pararhizobium sp.]